MRPVIIYSFNNVNVFAHNSARHNIGPIYHTAVLSSEHTGIEYSQVSISSATSIVLHAQNPLKSLAPGLHPGPRWGRLQSSLGASIIAPSALDSAVGASYSYSVKMRTSIVKHFPPPLIVVLIF